jgi:hypothetical protein
MKTKEKQMNPPIFLAGRTRGQSGKLKQMGSGGGDSEKREQEREV